MPFGWKQQIREVLWPDEADAGGRGRGRGALYAEQMMHDDEYN